MSYNASMTAELSPEIEVEDQWPESIRYRLPRRNWGRKRWIGVALVGLGLFYVLALTSAVLDLSFGIRPWLPTCLYVPLAMTGIPMLGGIIPLWWGWSILAGRREITIRNGKLRAGERIGFFYSGKRWKLETINSLNITGVVPRDPKHPHPQWAIGLDALIAYADGQRRMIAWGYPQALLDPLARALARDIQRGLALGAGGGSGGRPPVYVTNDYLSDEANAASSPEDHEDDFADDSDDDDDFVDQDITVQPADSKIEVDEVEDGLTVKIPPSGLLRGTSGLFVFSLIWNGIITAITICGGIAAVKDWKEVWNDGGPMIIAFFSLFWLVGIGILMASINMGRRRAAIAIPGDVLMVIQTGPFGTKRREWPLAEVREVRVGPSGMQVNDVDVVELQIHDVSDKKFGMLAGRKDEELYWLAQLVQRKINQLSSPPYAEPVAGEESATSPDS